MKRTILVMAVVLAGCAGPGERDVQVRTFDFGLEAPAARLGAVRAGLVRASAPYDAPDMYYRLAYRDPAELLAFSQSRGAAPPATLLQRRLARASPGGGAACTVDVELSELSQVFASREESDIVLEGRASLASASGRAGERIFLVREPGAGGSASGGARAVSRAADRLIGEIAAWASQAPACRAP